MVSQLHDHPWIRICSEIDETHHGISGLGKGSNVGGSDPDPDELRMYLETAREWLSSTATKIRGMSVEEFSSAKNLSTYDKLVFADVLRRAGRFVEASEQVVIVKDSQDYESHGHVIERQESAIGSRDTGSFVCDRFIQMPVAPTFRMVKLGRSSEALPPCLPRNPKTSKAWATCPSVSRSKGHLDEQLPQWTQSDACLDSSM